MKSFLLEESHWLYLFVGIGIYRTFLTRLSEGVISIPSLAIVLLWTVTLVLFYRLHQFLEAR